MMDEKEFRAEAIGLNEKSLREIVEEVAEEEGLTVEQVEEIMNSFTLRRETKNKATKPKRDKDKIKNKRKNAKASKRRNR